MYGSDCLLPRYGIHTGTAIQDLEKLGAISRTALEKILYQNGLQLFDLDWGTEF